MLWGQWSSWPGRRVRPRLRNCQTALRHHWCQHTKVLTCFPQLAQFGQTSLVTRIRNNNAFLLAVNRTSKILLVRCGICIVMVPGWSSWGSWSRVIGSETDTLWKFKSAVRATATDSNVGWIFSSVSVSRSAKEVAVFSMKAEMLSSVDLLL